MDLIADSRNTCAKAFHIAIFVVLGCACSVFGQTDSLQQLVHEKVNFNQAFTEYKGKKWKAEEKVLARYSKEQIVQALFAELDTASDNSLEKELRDVAAADFFEALHLSPKPICQELDRPQTPQRKSSLMRLLWHVKSPEVTQTLLRQIEDRRTGALEMEQMPELGTPHPWRVCDVAFNTLLENLCAKDRLRVGVRQTDEHKDERIRETLQRLGLTVPNDTPR